MHSVCAKRRAADRREHWTDAGTGTPLVDPRCGTDWNFHSAPKEEGKTFVVPLKVIRPIVVVVLLVVIIIDVVIVIVVCFPQGSFVYRTEVFSCVKEQHFSKMRDTF